MRKLQVINTNPRRLQWFKFTVNCEKDNGDITLFSLEEAKKTILHFLHENP